MLTASAERGEPVVLAARTLLLFPHAQVQFVKNSSILTMSGTHVFSVLGESDPPICFRSRQRIRPKWPNKWCGANGHRPRFRINGRRPGGFHYGPAIENSIVSAEFRARQEISVECGCNGNCGSAINTGPYGVEPDQP